MHHEKLKDALVAVMADSGAVHKTGRNSAQKYSYASDLDIVRTVRASMVKHGVGMFCKNVEPLEVGAVNGKQTRFSAVYTFSFFHAGSDEEISIQVPSSGQSFDEKGAFKCTTGARKYSLLSTFMLASTDDPEVADREPRQAPAPQQMPGRVSVPQAAAKPPRGAQSVGQVLSDSDLLGRPVKVSRADVLAEIRSRFSGDDEKIGKILRYFFKDSPKRSAFYPRAHFEQLQRFPAKRANEIYNSIKL